MAFKPSKPKPFTYICILFLIALLFFITDTLRELHSEFQKGVTNYPRLVNNPKWFEFIEQEKRDESINIGSVNFDGMIIMDGLRTKVKMVRVDFNPVEEDKVLWSDLFPEWIDENSPSNCPELPMPKFEDYQELDVVVAGVPCDQDDTVPLLSWVYKPELRRIKQKVLMPVGSCQLVPPFAQSVSGEELWRRNSDMIHKYNIQQPREAYVTALHSSEAYVCGAIVLAQSIILSNSTKDLVLLADDHISQKSLEGLRSAGWKIKRIQRIRSPHSKKEAYNEWNYSKLRIWQLKEYDKVMFIDSDLIVTKNLDEFFIYPQLSAVGNDKHIFNSGLMLVEPSECTFKTLMKKRFVVGSYNGGDQGFLNEMFPWWHRLPARLNHLKFFSSIHDYNHQMPQDMYTIHYLGLKPWMCYKDYDCNWDKTEFQHFASDSANEKWWHVYDTMPKKLRKYCSLTPQMDARIQKYRNRAKNASFPDGHWKIKIKDPRRILM
ncbi:Glycosyl transferase, family 8 - glycogenin [Handroanthus impetiginosus]|uniref:Hexosyltransferase n=1 Tax=Handroanthus impetiginosus TaxID=429701 RepID=A0A2G9H5Z3_9LAMI|nr:Glycosyl transferase, family 8 - glycogenin [Handroanthus impetiginosus]